MRKLIKNAENYITKKVVAARVAVSNNNGEGYIDTAVKILIAVVLGYYFISITKT